MTLLLMAMLGVAFAGAVHLPEQQGAPAHAAQGTRAALMPLLNTRWTLTAVGDVTPPEQLPREPHLIFYAPGTVTGSDGCNAIRATYTADEEALKFGDVLMGTLMNCPIAGKLDRRLREALVVTRSWKVTEDELTLLDREGTVLARFKARRDP